jgi:protein deglycase
MNDLCHVRLGSSGHITLTTDYSYLLRLDGCASFHLFIFYILYTNKGAEHLRDCTVLTELLQKQKQNGKLYAAICAAPAVALHAHGLMDVDTQTATCYPAPAFRAKLGAMVTDADAPVVVSGNLITSQGPGTALLFALELGQQLYGPEKRKEIADQMLVK